MPLGGAKDEHFSCFHRSCQLGLNQEFYLITFRRLHMEIRPNGNGWKSPYNAEVFLIFWLNFEHEFALAN